jgi:hypothetical protein
MGCGRARARISAREGMYALEGAIVMLACVRTTMLVVV